MASIGLVSCVSKKRSLPSKAEELYRSPLFEKASAYARSHCDRWFILSAKYGLVGPEQVVAPYDETLNDKTQADRKEWAQNVCEELSRQLSPGDRVVILAGRRYREFLVPKLRELGCSVEVPMEGLGIGKQLQWLTRALKG